MRNDWGEAVRAIAAAAMLSGAFAGAAIGGDVAIMPSMLEISVSPGGDATEEAVIAAAIGAGEGTS